MLKGDCLRRTQLSRCKRRGSTSHRSHAVGRGLLIDKRLYFLVVKHRWGVAPYKITRLYLLQRKRNRKYLPLRWSTVGQACNYQFAFWGNPRNGRPVATFCETQLSTDNAFNVLACKKSPRRCAPPRPRYPPPVQLGRLQPCL